MQPPKQGPCYRSQVCMPYVPLILMCSDKSGRTRFSPSTPQIINNFKPRYHGRMLPQGACCSMGTHIRVDLMNESTSRAPCHMQSLCQQACTEPLQLWHPRCQTGKECAVGSCQHACVSPQACSCRTRMTASCIFLKNVRHERQCMLPSILPWLSFVASATSSSRLFDYYDRLVVLVC